MKDIDPDQHTARRYEVSHITDYRYTQDVTASYGRACLRPRSTPEQHVLGNDIRIEPDPDALTEHLDMFGNYRHYFEVHTPHRRLLVAKTSIVEIERPTLDLGALDQWTVAQVAQLAAAERSGDRTVRAAYTLPSPLIELGPAVRAYAAHILTPQRPFGQGLAALVTAIHQEFSYTKGVTSVQTTLDELLHLRAGVCQDFAQLAIGALRSVGIPARYASGYLETAPPPGQPKLQGADATHAWFSAWLPAGGWLDLDPTNDCVADSRYIVTAWGRDYRDVAPLNGIIFTEGATTCLDVSVDVTRLTS